MRQNLQKCETCEKSEVYYKNVANKNVTKNCENLQIQQIKNIIIKTYNRNYDRHCYKNETIWDMM